MSELRFFVDGRPQTAGSKVALPIVKDGKRVATRIHESGNRELKRSWRQDIQAAASGAMESSGWVKSHEAVTLSLTFHRLRPAGHYGSGRNERTLKPSAPVHPTTKPDALKLARAAEDAMTGVVWADDSQVVDGRQAKVFADRFSGREGVEVVVCEAGYAPSDEMAELGLLALPA